MVKTEPKGAVIVLDGRRRSVLTPATFDSLVTGKHTVTLSLSDHVQFDTTIHVLRQTSSVITIPLSIIPATLNLTSEPTGIELRLAGETEVWDRTPVLNRSLEPKRYQIIASRPGYQERTLELNFKPGERHVDRVVLDPHMGTLRLYGGKTVAIARNDETGKEWPITVPGQDLVPVGTYSIRIDGNVVIEGVKISRDQTSKEKLDL